MAVVDVVDVVDVLHDRVTATLAVFVPVQFSQFVLDGFGCVHNFDDRAVPALQQQ